MYVYIYTYIHTYIFTTFCVCNGCGAVAVDGCCPGLKPHLTPVQCQC